MEHKNYTIYFDGEIAESLNPEDVKQTAQSVFNLNNEKITTLFNGSRHILKEDLSQAQCEQYLAKLAAIGLIAKAEPDLFNTTMDTTKETLMSNNNKETSPKKTSKTLPILGLVAIIGGAAYAWYEGHIDIPFLPKPESLESKTVADKPAIDPTNIIAQCTQPDVEQLLVKILAEGIPQLIERSSPNVTLTIQNYTDNQELYFDPAKNKRLCGVISKFAVESPNLSPDIQNPYVTYEVIYEIQKEADNSVRLSTFRQKIIASNIQNTQSSINTEINDNE